MKYGRLMLLACIPLCLETCPGLARPCLGQVPELIVESIRENPPQTAREALAAVQTLLNVNQVELALEYLRPLAESPLSDAQLAELNHEFGTAFFIRLTREPGLDPIGGQFARTVLDGSMRAARDPANVRRRVDQLLTAGPDHAAILIDQLQPAGSVAVAELVTRLTELDSEPQGSAVRSRLITAIGTFGVDAVDVLEGGIDSRDPRVARAAIEATRDLGDHVRTRWAVLSRLSPHSDGISQAAEQSVRMFLGRLPDSQERGCWLVQPITQLLEAVRGTDPRSTQDVWFWSPEKQEFQSRQLPARTALYYRALRLASRLFADSPQLPDAAALYAIAATGFAQQQAGITSRLSFSQPTGSLTSGQQQAAFIRQHFSLDSLMAALDRSLQLDTTAASLGLIELIRQQATPEVLASPHGEFSPLVTALRHPQSRVQLAAANAIVALQPDGPFRGLSDLMAYQRRMQNSSGQPAAIVVDPNGRRATRIAGDLGDLGYTAITVRTGKETLRTLLDNPDVELILLSAQTYEPPYWELLQELLHNRRIPIGLLGKSSDLPPSAMPDIEDPYGLIVSFPHPVNRESTLILVERLAELIDIDELTAHERLSSAAAMPLWSAAAMPPLSPATNPGAAGTVKPAG